jgi:pimeloyl-ACP methyl ester carboxylesterase
MTPRTLLVTALGTALVVLGTLVIVRADDGLVRERGVVAALPATTLRPPGAGPFPAVVVSHGFSASGRLMDGIAIAFARDGWLVIVPDHAGHGANHDPLTDADLPGQVADVVDALRSRDDVSSVSLLGHSMGAGAATQAAAADPALAVVALSLPSADELADDLTAFFAVGSLEPSRFGEAAREAAALGYPVVTVDGAEHITILFRTRTLTESVEWLDSVVGREAAPVGADTRMLGVAAVYLGSALLFWPVSRALVRRRVDGLRGAGSRVPGWVAVPVGGVVAGLVLAAVPALGELLPVAVGGYLAVLLAVAGAVAAVLARRWERPFVAAVLPGTVLGTLVAVAIAVPAQLAWAEVSLSGGRAASAVALVAAATLFGWGELLARGGYLSMVVGRLLLTGVVVVLAVTGSAPGFLTLLLPLLAVLLPWFGAYGVRVRDLSGSPLAGALAQAPPVALLVAITTPLV